MGSITDTQAKRLDILTRLDELGRIKAQTSDMKLLAYIEERETALRLELDRL